MSAISASPNLAVAASTPVVARSWSEGLGINKIAKGLAYFPLQWAAGVAAVYILTGFAPPPERVARVALVRAVGVGANNTIGDGIKNGIPFDLGIKLKKTPTENLYSLNLPQYAFQRVAYSASAATWSGLFAVAMTLMMPFAAPIFLAVGQSLSAAGMAFGGLATAASAQSSALGLGYSIAEGASLLLGNAMQLWPTAFAMKDGASLISTIGNVLHGVFMVNLVAGVLTDIVGLEKIHPKHEYKISREKLLAAAAAQAR